MPVDWSQRVEQSEIMKPGLWTNLLQTVFPAIFGSLQFVNSHAFFFIFFKGLLLTLSIQMDFIGYFKELYAPGWLETQTALLFLLLLTQIPRVRPWDIKKRKTSFCGTAVCTKDLIPMIKCWHRLIPEFWLIERHVSCWFIVWMISPQLVWTLGVFHHRLPLFPEHWTKTF